MHIYGNPPQIFPHIDGTRHSKSSGIPTPIYSGKFLPCSWYLVQWLVPWPLSAADVRRFSVVDYPYTVNCTPDWTEPQEALARRGLKMPSGWSGIARSLRGLQCPGFGLEPQRSNPSPPCPPQCDGPVATCLHRR